MFLVFAPVPCLFIMASKFALPCHWFHPARLFPPVRLLDRWEQQNRFMNVLTALQINLLKFHTFCFHAKLLNHYKSKLWIFSSHIDNSIKNLRVTSSNVLELIVVSRSFFEFFSKFSIFFILYVKVLTLDICKDANGEFGKKNFLSLSIELLSKSVLI